MKSGIYKIECIIDKKVYIGQSVDMKRRLMNHKSKLRKNKHDNSYLQNYVNKYGYENFIFEELELCEIGDLDERERYWIKHFDSMDRNKGFNRESGGHENKQFSQDRIQAITGEGNPMYGKKQSPEFIEYIRIHNRGSSDKLTENDVKEIKMALFLGIYQKELSKIFNVKNSTINKIAKCKNWEWILPRLNEVLINQTDKQKQDRDQKVFILNEEGFSNGQIANELKIAASTVSRVLKQKGIVSKNDKIKNLTNQIIELHRKHINNSEIALNLKINIKTVSKILKENDCFSKSGNRKLNEDTVKEIKKMLNENKQVKEIAEKYNIKRQTITDIKFNRTWKEVNVT